MRRWTLALLCLLGGLVGLSRADYVIIIANLGLVKEREEAEDQAQQNNAAGGNRGGPGVGRGGRGGRQQPGGGAGGQRPGGGGGRQQPGAGGGGVMQPPAGVGMMGGAPGMGAQGRGMMGMMGGPGMGMMGGPGMGMMGMMGAQGGGGRPGMGGQGGGMMGMMGMMGAQGGGMMGGPGMGMMGMMGMMGAQGGGTSENESTPYLIMTVVETKESLSASQLRALRKNKPVVFKHKWGTSVLRPDLGLDVIVMTGGNNKPLPSINKLFLQHNKEAHKDGAATADLLLGYDTNPQAGPAKFALEHGMVKEFREVMAEAAQVDPQNPKVKAFQAVEKAMAQPLTKADDSDLWKKRLGLHDSRQSEHYVLLYNGSAALTDKVIAARLQALEDSYRAFFYWFAMNCDKNGELAYVPKGQKNAPLVPQQRLVSVLTSKEGEFNKDHQILSDEIVVADGFTTRRDNLTVYSNERLDNQYKALRDYFSPQAQVYTWDKLLKSIHNPRPSSKSNKDFQIACTLAILMRSLEADSEVASVTHEVPRQLLGAIGLTHHNIVTPEWLQFGMGSFFETGKGAPWGGAGGPNWVYLQDYKDRASRKMAGRMDKPLDALMAVVTDSYFRLTNNGQNEGALKKARTMSWSLTYFLAHRKLDGLIRYYRELGKMPRDLEFDAESLLNLFARSFDCTDAGGVKPDNAKLTKLAQEWMRFIDLTPLEGEEVLKELKGRQSEMKASMSKPGDKKDDKKKDKEDDKPVAGDNK